MKSLLMILACTALADCLAGCGSFAPNSDTPSGIYLGIEQRPTIQDVSTVKIIETGAPPANRGVLVSGTSCKNKVWQPEPSRENAIALMKQQAAQRGMSLIYNLRVESASVSLSTNCWASITASGLAYPDNRQASASSQSTPATLEELVRKQTAQADKKWDQVRALINPLGACVKLRASSAEIYSSPESADVLARAAVALCSKEEGDYRHALIELAMVTSVDADDQIRAVHQKLLDLALATIIQARQRNRDRGAIPENSVAPKPAAI